MKQTRPLAALLLGLAMLSACSKSSTSTPAPTHTLRLDYTNTALNKNSMNLGAGFRAQVDGKALMLGGAADDTYYISSPDASAPIKYPDQLTISGNTLTLEVGFYNLYGTAGQAQPKNASGTAIVLPSNSLLGLQATIDGKALSTVAASPIIGMVAAGGLTYDNGKNPTKIVTIDLTKL